MAKPHPLDSYDDNRLRQGLEGGWFDKGKPFEEHRAYVEKRLGIKKTKVAKVPKSKVTTGATKSASKAKVPKVKKTSGIAPLPAVLNKAQLENRMEKMKPEELAHHAKAHKTEWVRNALTSKLAEVKKAKSKTVKAKVSKKATTKGKATGKPTSVKKQKAKKVPPTVKDIRAAQLSHPDASKRAKAINHIGTTWHELDQGIEDKHEDVRAAAAGHENASTRHLLRGLKDPSPKVRAAAINNPKATRALWHYAAKSNHPDVSDIAKKKIEALVKPKEVKKEKPKSGSFVSGTSSQAAAHNAGMFFGKLAKGIIGLGAGGVAGAKKTYKTGKNLVKAGSIGHAAAKKAFKNLQAQES